jgi:2-methylcitrate dehydratase PrpD
MSGIEFLTAVAVGYDIATRAVNGPLASPSDAYGSAAVACRALYLSPPQTAFALRVAGFASPRSGAQDFETNNLTCAQQARSGVEAAWLTKLGYPLSRALIEEPTRFAFSAPGRLGQTLDELYFKPYPACRYTHYYIEAALNLRPKIVGRLPSIDAIRIHVPTRWNGPAHRVGRGEYFKSYEFSIAYTAVAALVDGDFGLAQVKPERTDDSLIQELQARTSLLEFEAESDLAGTIEIVMTDGSVFSETVSVAQGGSERPLPDEALSERMVRWVGVAPEDADALLDVVMRLDTSGSLDDVAACMATLGERYAFV